MVESRDIRRSDLEVSHPNGRLILRMASVRLWDDDEEEDCSRFNVQIKLKNEQAQSIIDEDFLDGGTWTVVAHSDHNPNGGHNIHNQEDQKQLHIDIHPKITNKGYNETRIRICDGNPPETNDEAIRFVEDYMKNNAENILKQYLDYFRSEY